MGSGKALVGAVVPEKSKAPFHDLDSIVESHHVDGDRTADLVADEVIQLWSA